MKTKKLTGKEVAGLLVVAAVGVFYFIGSAQISASEEADAYCQSTEVVQSIEQDAIDYLHDNSELHSEAHVIESSGADGGQTCAWSVREKDSPSGQNYWISGMLDIENGSITVKQGVENL